MSGTWQEGASPVPATLVAEGCNLNNSSRSVGNILSMSLGKARSLSIGLRGWRLLHRAEHRALSTSSRQKPLSFETLALHADAPLATREVAPAVSVSTTFAMNGLGAHEEDGGEGRPGHGPHLGPYEYSRIATPTRSRAELVLGALEGPGCDAVLYASGLAACHGALVAMEPRRVVLAPGGYHGTRLVASVLSRLGVEVVAPGDAARFSQELESLGQGDVLWVESPLNPCATCADIRSLSSRCRDAGARLVIDSTLAPPPLQHCLE